VFSRVLDRSRDNLGRDTGWELKNGNTIENQVVYGYSATEGRLATVSNSNSAFRYDYLAGANLVEKVTGTAGAVHTVTNTYEPTRNVLDIKENKAGTTIISKYDYLVNAIGQRAEVNTSGTAFPATPSWAWGYDSLGQVISANSSVNTSDRAYQYDAIGNRKKSADSLTLPGSDNYTSNALNQYSSIGNPQSTIVNPLHDFDGNLTSGQLPTGSAGLVWDSENRLVSPTVNSVITTYLYDAQSRRIARTTAGSTTVFVYDGWNCIAEYSGTTLSKTRLWGLDLSGTLQGAGGVGGLLAEKQGSDYFFPTYDGNGNVSEYLAADGSTAAHFEYDPFGNTVVNTDTNNQFAYRFSTKPLDQVTGLYYYGYRYYDPLTGRWPSRDPIGENGGQNLYSYANNDGIINIDRLGLQIARPSTDQLKAECRKKIPSIIEKSEKIGEIRKEMAKIPGCKDPSLNCDCCPIGTDGQYKRKVNTKTGKGAILVCVSAITDFFGYADDNKIEAILWHEYTHALQDCSKFKNDAKTDCERSVCWEIQAYSRTNCKGLTPDKIEACIKDGVRFSSKTHCKNAAELETSLTAQYESCK
jgi:RHS repeat-associated protein